MEGDLGGGSQEGHVPSICPEYHLDVIPVAPSRSWALFATRGVGPLKKHKVEIPGNFAGGNSRGRLGYAQMQGDV